MLKKLLAITALAAFSFGASAQDYQAGKDYEVLSSPVVTKDKKKVEVVEVFAFSCGHCFSFEPMVNEWKKQQADDVNFYKLPAIWNKPMRLHAKAFYAAKAVGKANEIHGAIFTAMHVKKNRLATESSIEDLFVANGVDAETFAKAFNSFGINSQVNLADSRAKSYRIQGTPEMVVNGKYRVSTSQTGSQGNMLKVVDFLVNKERTLLAK